MPKIVLFLMKINLIVILIASSFYSSAQALDGKYIQQNYIDEGIVLTFRNNTFIYNKGGSINHQVGTGTYSIKHQILKLRFRKTPSQDTSFYSINSTPIGSDTPQVSVKLLDEQGMPSFGTVALRAKNYAILEQFHSDKKGDLIIGLGPYAKASCLTIDNIGFYRVTIPILKLKGQRSEIAVKLKPASIFYIEPKKVSYRIDKLSDNEMILSSGECGEIKLRKVAN